MRLLNTKTLKLSQFWDKNIPSYAILSHTWEEDELTLQQFEVADSGICDRQGYQKVKKCAEQAQKDGFEWIWVDTCCIDKTSSAELSEAINSMFRWYQKATICYVYLSDFDKPAIHGYQYHFAKCKWLKRGWTLQELIAPKKVAFFNASWSALGSKSDHAYFLSSLTRIAIDVLRGGPLKKYSLAQKMSWAASRQTTRKEDVAYCLLGIFDVHMPLLYGEGSRAFIRLQETIMARSSSDYSLLAWSRYLGRLNKPSRSLLADSPVYFRHSGYIMRQSKLAPRPITCVLVEDGIYINLRVQEKSPVTGQVVALLNCDDAEHPGQEVALRLTPQFDQQVWEVKDIILVESSPDLLRGEEMAVTIRQDNAVEESNLRDMPKLSIAVRLSYMKEITVFGVPCGRVVGSTMFLDVDDSWFESVDPTQILLRGPEICWIIHIFPSPNPLEKGVPRFEVVEEATRRAKFSHPRALEPKTKQQLKMWARASGATSSEHRTVSVYVDARGVEVDGSRRTLIIIRDARSGQEEDNAYRRLNPLPILDSVGNKDIQKEYRSSKLSWWTWFSTARVQIG